MDIRPILSLAIVVVGVSATTLMQTPDFGAARAADVQVPFETLRDDLDRDGSMEVVRITRAAIDNGRPTGGEIQVLRETSQGMQQLWREKNLNPWKLRLADVDGDGQKEIITGVWKKSPKDPVMAKRVFVWSWNGERMLPKWLGSRLSRRFEDFEVRDINDDGWAELLAMEISPGKPRRVGMYRWRSFGFDWLGSAEPTEWRRLTK